MNDKGPLIAALASSVYSRPSGLIPRLKRAPNSLRWRLIMAYWLLKREAIGMIHRLQGRRIVHVLHIGKTGGTAIKSALRGYENAGDYELVLHDHGFHLRDVPLGEKVVFVVRDPISRFVSGFYGRQRQDLPRHPDATWSAGEEIAFRQFSTPEQLALALSSDDGERRVAAVEAIKNISHLNSPHWIWFKDETYFLSRRSDILFVGFQETLNEDFALLKRLLNLPDEVRLPEDEVASHRNPAHVNRRLDEEAIRNLEIWYERDYRFLGRCREIAARIRSEFAESSPERTAPEPAQTPVATS